MTYTHEIWDGTSDINGVSAEYVHANYPTEGVLLLIRDDSGVVVQIQPTNPETGATLTKKTAATLGAVLADQWANPPAPEETKTIPLADYEALIDAADVEKLPVRLRETLDK